MAKNVGTSLALSRRSCLMWDRDRDSTQEEYERILRSRSIGSDCEEPQVASSASSTNPILDSVFYDDNCGSAIPTLTAACNSEAGKTDCYDEKLLVQRIRDFKGHGWDSICEDNISHGVFVLADCAIPGDGEMQEVQECARGLIVDIQPNLVCTMAFLNKGHENLTFATLALPDPRILYPIDDFDGGWSSGCDSS